MLEFSTVESNYWMLGQRPKVETLGQLMDVLAIQYGDRVLVDEYGGRALTYIEAAELVERISNAVAEVVNPNDRVVLHLPNGYHLFLACLGVARAGAVAVPINDQLTDIEVERIVAECEPALVVTAIEQIVGELGEPIAYVDQSDTAAVFYTSGTTGRPKGVELSHKALLSRLTPLTMLSGLGGVEAVYGLPLSHLMGFIFALSMSMAGVKVNFFPRFDAEAVLDAIESRRPQLFVGVPTMFRMLLEAGADSRDLHSIRVWFSSADAMPQDLARRFQDFGAMFTFPNGVSFGSAAFIEGYGMVELGGAVAAKVLPPLPFKIGLVPEQIRQLGDSIGVGLPFGGATLKVAGSNGAEVVPGVVGELWVKSPGSLKGYFRDRVATDRILDSDGWVRTGDLARRGPCGLIYFVGREKDVIKSGGYSIYAREVEEVLEEHPLVMEASVVGLEDRKLGEVPAAVVRIVQGSDLDETRLLDWCKDRLAHYKTPRKIRIVAELPRTETAKVRRGQLRSLFE